MDATALDALWDARWPDTPPIAHDLKRVHAERWVRIHSLPEAKRYAETEDERREVLHRHHEVLSAVGAGPEDHVVCIVLRWGSSDARRTNGPPNCAAHDGWLWRIVPPEEDDDFPLDGPIDLEEDGYHLYAADGPRRRWDELLRHVAEDEAWGVMIVPLDLSWIYHPYDGGGDVIARSAEERDQLRTTFADWLSSRADGL